MLAVFMGLVAALVASTPVILRAVWPTVDWTSPAWILGIAALAMLLQKFILDNRPGERNYDGLADLFIHVHAPSSPDSVTRWSIRGLISSLLGLFGGAAGLEGAAIEWGHAIAMKLRPTSHRWFEQRRRTDASVALACGISAVFGAPFAAVLTPLEMGLGGRAISFALGSIVAFLGAKTIQGGVSQLGFTVETFDLQGALYGVHWLSLAHGSEALAIALIVGVTGAFGALLIRYLRYSQESLQDLFQTQAWIRTLAGGALLVLVAYVYPPSHGPSGVLLQDVLIGKRSTGEVALFIATQLLSISLVVSAFGTVGILWPIFALGGYLGFLVDQTVLASLPGFAAVAGLAGGAALWGSVLGCPISGAVLAYELTHNTTVILPCLLAGLGARWVRQKLKTRTLIDHDLEARGFSLAQGRSVGVLDTIPVRDAMVSDFETVREQETVTQLYSRLIKSRYPFFPVVSHHGQYLGLLTADMIQESWRVQDPLASHSPLAKLLEAKDLLYRSGYKPPTVRVNDRLSSARNLFDEVPCVPVLGEDGRVQGLLFVYNVRLAYDREVARRAFS